jgi:hypothetical protein
MADKRVPRLRRRALTIVGALAGMLAVPVVTSSCHSNTSPNATSTSGGVADSGVSDALAEAEADGEAEAGDAEAGPQYVGERVIVVVAPGLRADTVGQNMPNLAALSKRGVTFSDHHSVFPSTTMPNAASLATGMYPGKHGVFGTTVYEPGLDGVLASGELFTGGKPVPLDDDGVLDALATKRGGRVYSAGSIIERAVGQGARTFAMGKAGAARLQDPSGAGELVDEQRVWPLDFAQALLGTDAGLPRSAYLGFPPGTIPMGLYAPYTTRPVAPIDYTILIPGDQLELVSIPSDPVVPVCPGADEVAYFSSMFLNQVLASKAPDLSILWLPSPDDSNRLLGPGTPGGVCGVQLVDYFLGDLDTQLKKLGLRDHTNLIVVSDHGVSSVAGDAAIFPLRGLDREDMEMDLPVPHFPAKVGAPDPKGYSLSGEVRLSEILYNAGWQAYDGPAIASSMMMGIAGTAAFDNAPRVYSQPDFASVMDPIPDAPPPGAVVVAKNGGSELVYLIGQDTKLMGDLVKVLQSRQEIGAIFVADRYGTLPGTLPLSAIGLAADPTDMASVASTPDLIVAYRWDDTASIAGVKGTEYSSVLNRRGTSGGSSPGDMSRGVLVAAGPSFKKNAMVSLPSSVVDIAPTIARIMGFDLDGVDGRVLIEALANPRAGEEPAKAADAATVKTSAPVQNLKRYRPTSPFSSDVDPKDHQFDFVLHTKKLHQGDKDYLYFDSAGDP